MRFHGVRRLRPFIITPIPRRVPSSVVPVIGKGVGAAGFGGLDGVRRIVSPPRSVSTAGEALPRASNVTCGCHSQVSVAGVSRRRPYEHADVPGFAAETRGVSAGLADGLPIRACRCPRICRGNVGDEPVAVRQCAVLGRSPADRPPVAGHPPDFFSPVAARRPRCPKSSIRRPIPLWTGSEMAGLARSGTRCKMPARSRR